MNANKRIVKLYDEINKLRSLPAPLMRINDDDQQVIGNKHLGGFRPKGTVYQAKLIPVIEVQDAIFEDEKGTQV